MTDRYTRAVLAVIALSALTLAAKSLSSGLPAARAQSSASQKRCVWSYIDDRSRPNIGKDGEVELKGKNWRRMSEEGWRLITAGSGGPTASIYVFERCDRE